jgi:hypothetical protein
MKTTFTAADEVHARGLSVDLKCSNCAAARDMDELNRNQIEALKNDLESTEARAIASIRDLAHALILCAKRAEFWKLVAFAGWFLSALLAGADILNRYWK